MAKGNKYNNKICYFKGKMFRSIKEMERYIILLVDKEVTNIKCQVPYSVVPESREFKETLYYADFVYDRNGIEIVEDVKGLKTGVAYDLFTVKKKLMYHFYAIIVQEV